MYCLEPGVWESALKSLLTLVLLSLPIYSGPRAIIKNHLAPLSLGRFIGSLVGMDCGALNNAFAAFLSACSFNADQITLINHKNFA